LRWRALRWLAPIVGIALVVQAAFISAEWIPRATQSFSVISSPTASALSRTEAMIPAGMEVIASQGVIGRFADRRLVFPFLDISDAGQNIPVWGKTVAIVLTPDGLEYATLGGTATAVDWLRAEGAHQITSAHGVYAFFLQIKPGETHLIFPPTPNPPPTVPG
jgi:hypothetical protein